MNKLILDQLIQIVQEKKDKFFSALKNNCNMIYQQLDIEISQ